MGRSVMITSILDQLRRDEGEVLHAYRDSLGYLTIGVGRLIDERRGGGITKAESAYLLGNDVDHVARELTGRLSWLSQLDEVRRGVFINMAFQLGVSGLLGFRHTLVCAEQDDWSGTARGMLDSKWARQTPARANRLAKQIMTGEWQ